MGKKDILQEGIPVSLGLRPTLEAENIHTHIPQNKKRLLTISSLAVLVGILISIGAKLLMALVYFITHVSFFGQTGFEHVTPIGNSLGIWVIFIPAAGGIIVGFMALYGSRAIRGHGIPEAMEQILTNKSKIKPSITYLKPVSSAIAIGTGGPFGAEGPIIATGGALGSTLGQLLKISDNERKILLASGATAGMAAVFGTPIAAIFLAVELLLFEFSPKAIIPVALACITGAAGHLFLFGAGPVFPMASAVEIPSNPALFIYSIIGILSGLLSVGVTKLVYAVEDGFEKLPIHWMWWPAIGGLAVGVVGYFAPETLGVGYENITNLLSGTLPLQLVLSLCFLKFLSWVIALGSGTSGGTLAPLLTIGGAAGVLMGLGVMYYFPDTGITVPLAALIGMSALFAGASRALLTSIVFALEVTGQANALLPLLAGCTAAYFVSYFLMENTIMTEKITRRGVRTPDSYMPDVLETLSVGDVFKDHGLIINDQVTLQEVRSWLEQHGGADENYFILVDEKNTFTGIISSSNLFSHHHPLQKQIGSLVKRKIVSIGSNHTLRAAAELMASENVDILPVVSADNQVIGILSYKDILVAYTSGRDSNIRKEPSISLKRQGLKMLVRGQKVIDAVRGT